MIIPLKTALNTRDVDIIAVALKVIQKLVTSSDLAGEALVPYYRQLLPVFNLYRNNCNVIGATCSSITEKNYNSYKEKGLEMEEEEDAW